MNELCGTTLSTQACEIVDYLARCPTVCDTLEGIALWRLPTFRIEREIDLVKRGLDELIALQFVQSTLRNGRVYYQVNPEKLEEIHTRLQPPAASPAARSTK